MRLRKGWSCPVMLVKHQESCLRHKCVWYLPESKLGCSVMEKLDKEKTYAGAVKVLKGAFSNEFAEMESRLASIQKSLKEYHDKKNKEWGIK